MVMEHLVGEDLGVRLRRVGRLPADDVVRIVGELCEGLAHAHGKGLVHRDLKPRNVFLARVDDREMVKILDFGIVKVNRLDATSRTRTGDVLGTPQYMSPEQVAGSRDVDLRADLWALGVLAYRALLGRLPFEGETVADLVVSIITGPIPVPSELDPSAPPGFDAWFARACTREPSKRFGSARELAESLRAALGAGPLDERARTSSPSRAASGSPEAASLRDDELPTRVLEQTPPPREASRTSLDAASASASRARSPLPWLTLGLVAALVGALVGGLLFWSRRTRPELRAEAASRPAATTPPPAPPAPSARGPQNEARDPAATSTSQERPNDAGLRAPPSATPRHPTPQAPPSATAAHTAAPTTPAPTASPKDEWGF
jgi:serine/threonine protein kinase